VASVELRHAGPLAYREALPAGEASGPAVVLVHGFPESSLMWEPLMERLAAAGRRCVAPDLYNLGDSEEAEPATFESNHEAFSSLMDGLDLGDVAVVVHDWGGFIGLAWVCDNPDRVRALVISDTGFFSDGRWHGLADAVRGPEGEALVDGLNREGFSALLNGDGNAFSETMIDAYWRPFEEGRGRRATLDFYRSMDFPKLAPWDGKLGGLTAPALILWGAEDPFATMAAAKRFDRESPDSRLVAVEGAGHFVWEEEPERCAGEVLRFLGA
jgi:haloalkane dehalogenase